MSRSQKSGHVVCHCPQCEPVAIQWSVKLLNAPHQILKASPNVAELFPRVFSVRCKEVYIETPDDAIEQKYGPLIGYVVARPDCLPFKDSLEVRML